MINIISDLHFGPLPVLPYKVESSPISLLWQVPQLLECCVEMTSNSQWLVICHPGFLQSSNSLLHYHHFPQRNCIFPSTPHPLSPLRKPKPQHQRLLLSKDKDCSVWQPLQRKIGKDKLLVHVQVCRNIHTEEVAGKGNINAMNTDLNKTISNHWYIPKFSY